MLGSTPTGWFTGLSSPAAGGTLAVYYPFSQTRLYHETLAYLDLQDRAPVVLIILLSVLMVSTIKYPKSPKISVRSLRGVIGLIIWLALLVAIVRAPSSFLFPMALAYVTYGVLRFFIRSLLDRPDRLALQSAEAAITTSPREEEAPR
jgi:phosphatidylserine synthase